MGNLLLTAWFIIKIHTINSGIHEYYLLEPRKNIHVNLTSIKPLPYGEGANIKLTIDMKCETVNTTHIRGLTTFSRNDLFCNAKEYRIENCTEHNSFVVNGVRYC